MAAEYGSHRRQAPAPPFLSLYPMNDSYPEVLPAMLKEKINLMYIEDDEADVDFAQSALKDVGCTNFDMTVIEDGAEALHFFKSDDQNQKWPDLVLLDLNLPKVNGIELLKT